MAFEPASDKTDPKPPEEGAPDAPAEESVSFEPRRLHPVTLLQQFLMSLPALFVIMLPFFFGGADGETWGGLIFLILYALVALPLIVLQYLRFSYWMTEKEIIIQSGVIKRNNRSIPLERVQNIQIVQSVIPRMFGTAKVKIETAGSGGTEGELEYVKVDEAQRLRRKVRAFQRGQTTATTDENGAPADGTAPSPQLDEQDEEDDRTLIHKMPFERVLLSGMFRFSLLYIAVIFSILTYIPDWDEMLYEWMMQGQLQWLAEAATHSPWTVALATIIVAALLSWITGMLLNLNRYFGFELWLEKDKLYRKHGLLTHSEGNIPLKKVQALILRSNPLMRYFGWYILEVQTMGVDSEGGGHQVAVPFAQRDEIVELAQHIREFELPDDFDPVSKLHIRRVFVRTTVGFAIIVGIVSQFFWTPAYWALLGTPLLLYYAYQRYLNHGYSLEPELFFVRGGVFRHHIWVLPTEKHQVFYATESIFQRRLNLKTVSVDTAGAMSRTFPDVVDLPADEADSLLARLYAAFTHYFESNGKSPPRKELDELQAEKQEEQRKNWS